MLETGVQCYDSVVLLERLLHSAVCELKLQRNGPLAEAKVNCNVSWMVRSQTVALCLSRYNFVWAPTRLYTVLDSDMEGVNKNETAFNGTSVR